MEIETAHLNLSDQLIFVKIFWAQFFSMILKLDWSGLSATNDPKIHDFGVYEQSSIFKNWKCPDSSVTRFAKLSKL